MTRKTKHFRTRTVSLDGMTIDLPEGWTHQYDREKQRWECFSADGKIMALVQGGIIGDIDVAPGQTQVDARSREARNFMEGQRLVRPIEVTKTATGMLVHCADDYEDADDEPCRSWRWLHFAPRPEGTSIAKFDLLVPRGLVRRPAMKELVWLFDDQARSVKFDNPEHPAREQPGKLEDKPYRHFRVAPQTLFDGNLQIGLPEFWKCRFEKDKNIYYCWHTLNVPGTMWIQVNFHSMSEDTMDELLWMGAEAMAAKSASRPEDPENRRIDVRMTGAEGDWTVHHIEENVDSANDALRNNEWHRFKVTDDGIVALTFLLMFPKRLAEDEDMQELVKLLDREIRAAEIA